MRTSRFTLEKKGYSRAEVDQYLNQLLRELELFEKRVGTLKSENELLEKRTQEMRARETVIEDAIVNAQLAADRIRADAEKQAAALIAERVGDAEEKLFSIAAKEKELKALENRIKYVLQSQLAVLDNEE